MPVSSTLTSGGDISVVFKDGTDHRNINAPRQFVMADEKQDCAATGVLVQRRAQPELTFFRSSSGLAHPLQEALSRLCEALSVSRFGGALLGRARKAGYRVVFSPRDDDSVIVNHVARAIDLADYHLTSQALARSPYFVHVFQMAVVRGLRLIDQARNSRSLSRLAPDQAVLAARVVAADQMAVMIHVLHDIRDDLPGLWRHVMGSDHGDMAARYTDGIRQMQQVRHSLGEIEYKRALNAAFLLWYRDETRVAACDRTLLSVLDARPPLVKGQGSGDLELDYDFYQGLTRDEGGEPYLNDMTYAVLLSPVCQSILDPINAHHLAQLRREQDLTFVHNVGFRDAALARALFPDT